MLALIFAFLKNELPCCRSNISPFNLSSIISTSAKSLEIFCDNEMRKILNGRNKIFQLRVYIRIIGRKTKKLTFAKRLMVQAIPTLPTPTTVTLCVLVGTGSITVFNSLLLNDAIILYINSRIGSFSLSIFFHSYLNTFKLFSRFYVLFRERSKRSRRISRKKFDLFIFI